MKKETKPPIVVHSVDAESSVLSAILHSNSCLTQLLGVLRPDDFYEPIHSYVYEAMLDLHNDNKVIDVITLADQLKINDKYKNCGGHEIFFELVKPGVSASYLYHAKIIKDYALKRNLSRIYEQAAMDVKSGKANLAELASSIANQANQVSEQISNSDFRESKQLAIDSLIDIESLQNRDELTTGVSSGFHGIDKLTAGFQKSDLIILAARPAMGKTSLAMNFCEWAAIYEKKNVVVFSLEMSWQQLMKRMYASQGRINSTKLRTGGLDSDDFAKMVDVGNLISESNFFVDDTPSIAITDLQAKCRKLARKTNIDLIIVDYLQLVRSPEYKNHREQEIAHISRSLKETAKELQVPVIALSQLNRAVESRNVKRPLMSDLRESGAIEQDADIIMFIYRDEVYDDLTADRGVAEIIISKHRSGPTGIVRLAFSSKYTKFQNLID